MGQDRMTHSSGRVVAAWLALGLVGAAQAQVADPGANGNADQQLQQPLNVRPLLAQPGLAFGAGVQYSSNVLRTAGSAQSGGIASLTSILDLMRTGTRLDYDLTGNLRLSDYINADYPTKLLGFLDGSAAFGIVPEVFQWTVRDTYNQLGGDPFQSPTPESSAAVNYFTTGPRIILHPGILTTLTLSGTYGKTSTGYAAQQTAGGDEDLDSTRYSGEVRLKQALSGSTAVSVAATTERVEFANPAADTDYTLNSATVGYEAEGRRTHVDAALGYVQLRVTDENFSEPTAHLVILRRTSPFTTVALTASQQFEDALDLGRDAGRSPTGQPFPNLIAQAGAIRDRNAGLAWTYASVRNSLVINGNWDQEESEFDSTFNRTSVGGGVRYLRRLWATLSLDTSVAYWHENFEVSQIHDAETDAAIGLTYLVGRQESINLRYGHYDRRGSVPGDQFVESRVELSFLYRVF
jgi:Putative beta-barrel porin 2